MKAKIGRYRAILSSDWSECLAPCSPFDPISFNYPELTPHMETIFKDYTGNRISLGEAIQEIQKLLPCSLTEEQMDAYLDKSFVTYRGVPEFIKWCLSQDILFMINSTAMAGYFQRILQKGLLPPVPFISAHPMIRYPQTKTDLPHLLVLLESQDKAKNTEAVMNHYSVPARKIILMGDSSGDGPHFQWGAGIGAFLIGSMTKPSLARYCRTKGISIHAHFGLSYQEGEKRDLEREMAVHFMDLAPVIEGIL